jgi:hypothetical protein
MRSGRRDAVNMPSRLHVRKRVPGAAAFSTYAQVPPTLPATCVAGHRTTDTPIRQYRQPPPRTPTDVFDSGAARGKASYARAGRVEF